MDIKDFINNLTEADAFSVLHEMQKRFGWTGTMFTRDDVEQEWRAKNETDDNMPDDIWEEIRDGWWWRKGITDMMISQGWEGVAEAVNEIGM